MHAASSDENDSWLTAVGRQGGMHGSESLQVGRYACLHTKGLVEVQRQGKEWGELGHKGRPLAVGHAVQIAADRGHAANQTEAPGCAHQHLQACALATRSQGIGTTGRLEQTIISGDGPVHCARPTSTPP